MKLKSWDWENERYEEVEYPDEIIQEFVNFMRLNKQWPERLEIMYNRFLAFQRDLTDVRNKRALETAVCTAITKSGEPCHVANDIKDGLCHIHRRALVAA